jgi:hypothetical protein
MLTQEVDATVHAQDWPGQVDQGAKLSEQKWQMEQASGRLSEEQIQRVAHDPASKQAETQQLALSAASEQQTQQQSQRGRPRKGSKLRQSKQWMEQTSGRPSKCHAQQRASSRASSKVSNGPRSKAAAKQAADGALHQLHFHSQCRDPWPVVL